MISHGASYSHTRHRKLIKSLQIIYLKWSALKFSEE